MQETGTECICDPTAKWWARTDGYAACETLWPSSAVPTLTKGGTIQPQFEAAHGIKGLPSDALCLQGSKWLER